MCTWYNRYNDIGGGRHIKGGMWGNDKNVLHISSFMLCYALDILLLLTKIYTFKNGWKIEEANCTCETFCEYGSIAPACKHANKENKRDVSAI